jgi:hypothetical protein
MDRCRAISQDTEKILPFRIRILASCPINNEAFAVGQLAVFQGGASRTGTNDEHI